MSAIDSTMLPSASSRAQLVEMLVEVQTEQEPKTIQQFVHQLREILDNLVKTQEKHKSIHKKMMDQCFEEESFRKKEEVAAKRALAKSMAKKARCEASLNSAKKALPHLKRAKNDYEGELSRAAKARNEERKRYQARRAEFKDAIEFMGDFISFVHKKLKGQFRKSFAFVELSENLLKHASKLNIISEVTPVLLALAQDPIFHDKAHDYKYQPNEVLARKLQDLLSQLFNRLKADNLTNNKLERAAEKVFTDYSSKLKNIIATLKRNIKKTKQQIVNMTRCVSTEKGIIASAARKNARNKGLRLQAKKMCHAFNNEFIEATRNRLDEIKTMKDILTIVHRRFKKIPRDLITYLESVKKSWKAYVNATEFKKYVEYKRKAYVDNKRGRLLSSKHSLGQEGKDYTVDVEGYVHKPGKKH
jgi:predicted  nucleic acid-binding Zn-ribbon protein